ncbi:MlaD family protein [Porphyromonas sp. oral taxon 278]|uniref:MlaD family protein n=1 Tax=Porphyromonas sp. oral taxon 278 TaxID=712437 RepID=UPI0025FB4A63|nr:MlaD family protein [Porphyromonas sp. oral taxon 278]
MKRKKEVQIGLLAILAIALAYVGINFLKGIEIFKKSTTYYAHFDNLNSVTVATPVLVSGFKVGTVRSVSFDYARGYGATVELSLDPHVRITPESQVRIKMNPLSGSELILQIGPKGTQALAEGDTIPSISPQGDLLSVATDKILPEVANMMPTINATLERLNALLNDRNIDSTLLGLNHASQQLHGMVAGLNQTTHRLDPVISNVGQVTSNLATFSGQLSSMHLDSLMLSLQSTTAQLQQVSQQLRSKDNTAGLLLNDPALYIRLDSLVRSADHLMRDLKENPKRYVRLSIF